MIKDALKVILIVIITAIITVFLYRCRYSGRDKDDATTTDTLTIVKVDTTRISTPIYIRSRVVDTIKVIDTLLSRDTLYIPIEQRVYRDSNYVAYVSGYMPSLDSITLFNRTVVYRDITTTIAPLKPRPKRFGLGVQVGYGIGTNGLQPYIGVGLSYNVFVF